MKLRDYQEKAADAAFASWRENTSTLIVLPTGGGKTVTFAQIAKRFLPARTLVIAHRDELVFQAKEKLEAFGLTVDVEMADLTATTGLFGAANCVVASVQTMHRRLARFEPNSFGLLIVDEVHHGTATTYRKVLDHFKKNPDLRVLGVTATPDRSDEEALGQIIDDVAFDYEILDAIQDGWLVPVEQQLVHVAGLDFSHVRTTSGDLNGADLAAVMEQEENLQGICSSSIELIGERQSIMFASSVLHAEKACEIFNRHRPNMATFICGETNKDLRRDRIQAFKDGSIQILTNVGIATEGADFPNVAAIIGARPTESRSLYAQMAGRALRPLSGLVDQFPTPEERRAAIAASSKPHALLIDFSGNSGKHKLMSSLDILGGKVSDEIMTRAQGLIAKVKGSANPVEVLAEAEEQLRQEREARRLADEARRARLVAKAKFSTTKINPFDAFELTPAKSRGWDMDKVLSEKQRAVLLKAGVDPSEMPYAQAKQLLNEQFRRWNSGLATLKQCSLLKKHGVPDAAKFTMKEASALIDKIANNRWHFTPDMLPKRPEPDVPF